MIVLNNKKITDPVLLTNSEKDRLREILFVIYPKVFIPEHIISNKEKTEYKAGFLNELFIAAFPDEFKKNIYEVVTKRFDIFVEKRQYLNLVREYTLKKYSVFIKN
jgi:hypothetical protein